MSSNDPNHVISSGAYKVSPDVKKTQNRKERFKALAAPFLEDREEKELKDIVTAFSKANKTTQMCVLNYYEQEEISGFCALHLDGHMNDYGGTGIFLEKESVEVALLLSLKNEVRFEHYPLKLLEVLYSNLKSQIMNLYHVSDSSALHQEEVFWKKFIETFHEEGAIQYCGEPHRFFGTGSYQYKNDQQLYSVFLVRRILFYRHLLSKTHDKALFGDRGCLPTFLLLKDCSDLEGNTPINRRV